MRLSHVLVLLASLSLVSVVPIDHAKGQCRVNEAAKLTALDADRFGWSVSINGDVAVVGSHWDDEAGSNSGAAYIYRLDGQSWVEEQKLSASDAFEDANFGFSVSVSGDVAVVGEQTGQLAKEPASAYIYRFDPESSEWVEEQKLSASDRPNEHGFGVSVSISGDVAIVGAFRDENVCPGKILCNSGAAYVYRFDPDASQWVEEQRLSSVDGTELDQFGRCVAISGDVAIVGADLDDDVAWNSGSAYIYRHNGRIWIEEQKLTAVDPVQAGHFGSSVSISGNVAAVGPVHNAVTGIGRANVYRYEADGSGWIEEQTLIASDSVIGSAFGQSLSISGDMVIVGARTDGSTGSATGSAYMYRFDGNTWVEVQKLTASDGEHLDFFGSSVSLSGDLAVVGAFQDDNPGLNSGSAYVFGIKPAKSDPPCGAIDAREPSAPDGSNTAGWDSIAITFDEPLGQMNPKDFVVVINPPGDAPTVTDVTVDGNTATVHFEDFIPTEAWTTVTHWPTGAVTRIGYLPADVNNDKLSNATDVLHLIDVLNGVIDPAPPAYQTDTDRSGATNASDVLRVIDLLNGAGVYEEYLDAELPA